MLHTCQDRDPLNLAVELIIPLSDPSLFKRTNKLMERPVPSAERSDRLYGNLATKTPSTVGPPQAEKEGTVARHAGSQTVH